MIDAVRALHDSDEVHALLRQVESSRLAHELGDTYSASTEKTAAERLRVAAEVALAELLASQTVDGFLRSASVDEGAGDAGAQALPIFEKWVGYINALLDVQESPTWDDLLMLAVAGSLARRSTDVRRLLRHPVLRLALTTELQAASHADWPERVQLYVSIALLFMVRQENLNDVEQAGSVIQELARLQQDLQPIWLNKSSASRKDGLELIGLFHLAQAVIYMSEFLVAGTLVYDERTIVDFAPQLRRLLVRAEEYILLSNNLDTRFWLNAVSMLLWRLRADSVWVSARGINERIDELLTQLVHEGRQNPVFSLMPSQQDAIRSHLLDPAQIAVVLQMPTSAGKTLLAEFAIAQVFGTYRDTSARIVYVAPTRALATQVRRTLSEDLGPLGIQVSGAGSAFEEDPFELHLLESNDGVLVATPEKLDLLLRTHRDWFDSLRLVVVDEAHLLRDGERGVRLELLLANIRREEPNARLLLLTPFIENAQSIARWLGEARGLSIHVRWRPSNILLGLAKISGSGSKRAVSVQWMDPYAPKIQHVPLRLPTQIPASDVQSTLERVVYLAERFQPLGAVLAMFSGSREKPEDAARRVAEKRSIIPHHLRPPALRLAIALAKDEFGETSSLARCLERGVAYHHSALSPLLKYLVEEQIRAGTINFIAATTTLAQGMNFPVATVLVHSVSKPWGKGDLSPSEFWNIAGRAGRVGMADRGLVIFADPRHERTWKKYSTQLSDTVESALLQILGQVDLEKPLKGQYEKLEALRPYLQYLVHAAASRTPARALVALEEIVQASLANMQVTDSRLAFVLRQVAQTYLQSLRKQSTGYLKTVDSTGLGSFSFDELYAKVQGDEVLSQGPNEVLRYRERGLRHLVDVLKWLPELNLALGLGKGPMDSEAAARVIQGWVDGKSTYELSHEFLGEDDRTRTRKAAHYLYSTVSQNVSWGAHAYLRGWAMQRRMPVDSLDPTGAMLPTYIQYGVHTPEAAMAALLNVPRQIAEGFAVEYRERHGVLRPEETSSFKQFLETANADIWRGALARSRLAGVVDVNDIRTVWRQLQGLG